MKLVQHWTAQFWHKKIIMTGLFNRILNTNKQKNLIKWLQTNKKNQLTFCLMTDHVVLIFIDTLVCGIIFSAADKFAPSALKRCRVLCLPWPFADINKNMLAQNGNSDLSCRALIERPFIIPICAFNQTSISKYEPCWWGGVRVDWSRCHK